MITMLQRIREFHKGLDSIHSVLISSCSGVRTEIVKTDSLETDGGILIITRETGEKIAVAEQYIIKISIVTRGLVI